jgi:hypothetical protein
VKMNYFRDYVKCGRAISSNLETIFCAIRRKVWGGSLEGLKQNGETTIFWSSGIEP